MPIFLLVFGDLINSVNDPYSGGHDYEYYIQIQVYIGVVAFATAFIGTTSIELAAERQIRKIRHNFVQAMMRQAMAWMDSFDPRTLASQLNQSCVTIRDGFGTKFGQLFMFLGMIIGGYTVGFLRGWKLTLVISAVLPLLAGVGYLFMKSLTESETRSRETYGHAGAVAEEVFGNIRTVVAFGSEEQCRTRYCDLLNNSLNESLRSSIYFGGTVGLTFGVLFLSYALGLWYGGELVANDLESDCTSSCFTAGDVLAVFFSIVTAALAVGQCGTPLTAAVKASGAAKELWCLIDRSSAIDPLDSTGRRDVPIKGEITFKSVNFHYPCRPEQKVFEALSFTVPAGKTVALVGTSGSGKSTVVQLIERFYDPIEGQILLDGVDLREYNLQWLREQMGLVNQEPRLFARTLRDNILDGKLDATATQVAAASQNANAAHFVADLPKGLDTFAGEGGAQLSGGQKQRIAIARAIIRDPAILILDEATSALDAESERVVQETLDRLLAERKRTTLIIAHRLSTVRRADLIIVLKNMGPQQGAMMVESGSHEELMAQTNSIYRGLVEAQQLGTELIRFASSKRHSLTKIATSHESRIPPADMSLGTLRTLQTKHTPPDGVSPVLSASSPGIMQSPPAVSVDQVQAGLTFPPLLPPVRMTSSGAVPPVAAPLLSHSSTVTTTKPLPLHSQAPPYSQLLQELRPHKGYVALGVVGSAGAGLAFPGLAIALAGVIEAYSSSTPEDLRHDVAKWSLVLVVIAIFVAGATLAQLGAMECCGHLLVKRLRERLFEQIIYQDIAFFDHPDHSTGALSELLSSDVLLIKGLTGDNLGITVKNAVSLVVAIIIAFTASARLAAVTLAAFLSIVPAGALNLRFIKGNRTELEASAEAGGFIISETLGNIRIVHSYGLYNRIMMDYDSVLQRDYRTGRWNAIVGGFFIGLSQFLQFGAQALTLWYGAKLLERHQIKSVSSMLRAIFSLMITAIGIGQSLVFLTDVKKAQGAAARVYALLDHPSAIDARRSTEGTVLHPEAVKGRIDFRDVVFYYPNRPDVCVHNKVTFTVEPGETVALVGSSGCGKSTLIQLLERFYDLALSSSSTPGVPSSAPPSSSPQTPQSTGCVSVDGFDVRVINIRSLRSNMALVSQEPVLFNTTIRENIEYGRPGATKDEIVHAAQLANAHNFIVEFPDQYETSVGSYGSKLSGGQKQRIAIARAILRNPKILLLDEATSALDTESEKVVQQALNELLQQKDAQRSTIIIAHRLSTIRNADKIIVLANPDKLGASVVEVGTHSSLMRLPDGVYRRLVQIAMVGGTDTPSAPL